MSAPTLIRRELKNARLYFIPSGETVDSVAVTLANATWPDNDPTTNWTAFQFVDIETVKESKEVETETFKVPKASGGYTTDTEEMLIKRMWTAVTAKTNNYLKQLEHAVPATVVASTAQAPFTKNNNYLEGIMLMEIQNKNGVIIERTQVWARLRLVSAGDVGPSTAKVEISLEQRDHANNSYVAYAG